MYLLSYLMLNNYNIFYFFFQYFNFEVICIFKFQICTILHAYYILILLYLILKLNY